MNAWHSVRVHKKESGCRSVVVEVTQPAPGVDALRQQGTPTGHDTPDDLEGSVDADVDADVGADAGADADTETTVPAPRVLPRPEPVICTTCLGVGSLRVHDDRPVITWISTSTFSRDHGGTVIRRADDSGQPSGQRPGRRQRTRKATCDRCGGLGWVLIATDGPVQPARAPIGPLPGAPWWQPQWDDWQPVPPTQPFWVRDNPGGCTGIGGGLQTWT